jgi:biotin carboxyl carrier protein
MKLNAEWQGELHRVALRRAGATVVAEVDGRSYALELQTAGDGNYLLLDGDTVLDCHVAEAPGRRDVFVVGLRGRSFSIVVSDPKRLRGSEGGSAHGHGSAEITAPMPGRVVRVLVESGAEVEAGAGLVVVEAMKMQNELKAPRAGRVVALHAQPGATVNAGEVLAVVE